MIWFSADIHLDHSNIMRYCNRPFETVEEMNNTIIENFEKTIKKGDSLYFLGDITFNPHAAYHFFRIFKGVQIHLIKGNHDKGKVVKLAQECCNSVTDLKSVSINGQNIILCHYCMRVWSRSHFNSWQLYGHSHGGVAPIGKQMDVGVDTHNFMPYSFDEVKEFMDRQPDNFNYISLDKRRENEKG